MEIKLKNLPVVLTHSQTIALELIDINPLNPRHVAENEGAQLAESLKREGQLIPIWVRPNRAAPGRFELVDGERRYRGARAAAFQTLEAEVGDFTDEHVVRIAFNTAGPDGSRSLSAIAEARALRWLLDNRPGATYRSVGEQVGQDFRWVERRIKVLGLPEEVGKAVERGDLPISTAVELCSVVGGEERVLEALAAVLKPLEDGRPVLSQVSTRSLVTASFGKLRPEPAAVAIEGTTALSAEENAKAFPIGIDEPEPESGFVAWSRPIPADLLKPEVVAVGPVKFADVAEGVPLFTGVTHDGTVMVVAKLASAIVGTKPEDRRIFREEVARKYALPKPKPAEGAAPSRRVEEELAAKRQDESDRVQQKKDKASRAWLEVLREELAAAAELPWARLPYWTLLFELQLAVLTEAEARFSVACVAGEISEPDAKAPRAALECLARSMSPQHLGALVTLMLLVPRLRVEGSDAPLAVSWHETFLAELKEGEE